MGKHTDPGVGRISRALHELNGRIHACDCEPRHRAEEVTPRSNLLETIAESKLEPIAN